ncbi:MAG: hypothetical protein LBR51_07390, partial [Bacteroidales bacterium]|nr:hypothetical protein [Bacteroidales bacterium]
NAEIGFRYINFTGKEKSLTFSGEDLENITYIKVFAGGKLLGERRGTGVVALKNVPKGKSEVMISVTTLGEVKLETMRFNPYCI